MLSWATIDFQYDALAPPRLPTGRMTDDWGHLEEAEGAKLLNRTLWDPGALGALQKTTGARDSCLNGASASTIIPRSKSKSLYSGDDQVTSRSRGHDRLFSW